MRRHEVPVRIQRKAVRSLSHEDKEELKRWYIRKYGYASWERDTRRRTDTAPTVRLWIRYPNLFDIPGVDTPGSQPPGPAPRREPRRVWSLEERILARRIYEHMKSGRGNREFKYVHALHIARTLRQRGVNLDVFDATQLDRTLEFDEIMNDLTRRLGGDLRVSADYIEYIERRLAREELSRSYRSISTKIDRAIEWEIRHMDELLGL